MRSPRGAAALVVAFVALVLFVRSAVVVGAGERGIVFSIKGGTKQRVLHEGLNFIVPFVEDAKVYPVRVQIYTMSATSWEGEVQGDDSIAALTSDGQAVKLDVSLRFHIQPENVWRLHKDVGPDYISKIIRPELTSLARNVVSAYPITDVYSTKREQIAQKMQDSLAEALLRNYLVVDEVLLRNVEFSEAFHGAIEQKQIAQQQAQRMQYVLQKAKMEKEQKIIEADGDAKAIRLKGAALAENARVVQYEYLQKLAPNVQAIITDGKSLATPAGGGAVAR